MAEAGILANFVAGDDGTRVRVRCKDRESGAPIDLTGQTVTLRWQVGTDNTEERPMTNLTPESDPANKGRADYVFVPADVAAGGIMAVEVRLTDNQARPIISVNTEFLRVKDPLITPVP